MTQSSLEREGLTGCIEYSPSSEESKAGTQGRTKGSEAETTEEHYLLACSITFLLQPTPTRLGIALPTLDQALLPQLRKCPTDVTIGQSNRGSSSFEVPFSQVMLGLCQVDR